MSFYAWQIPPCQWKEPCTWGWNWGNCFSINVLGLVWKVIFFQKFFYISRIHIFQLTFYLIYIKSKNSNSKDSSSLNWCHLIRYWMTCYWFLVMTLRLRIAASSNKHWSLESSYSRLGVTFIYGPNFFFKRDTWKMGWSS